MIDEMMLEELSRFDGDYTPQSNQILPGIDKMPDGAHVLEIQSAEISRTPQSGDLILKLALKTQAGTVFEKATFLNDQKKVNQLGHELCALGLEADKWKGDRPFSKELVKALPKLKGIRFHAHKTTDIAKDGKTWHNLLIAGLARPGTGGPAGSAPPPGRAAPNGRPAQAAVAATAGGDATEVPF